VRVISDCCGQWICGFLRYIAYIATSSNVNSDVTLILILITICHLNCSKIFRGWYCWNFKPEIWNSSLKKSKTSWLVGQPTSTRVGIWYNGIYWQIESYPKESNTALLAKPCWRVNQRKLNPIGLLKWSSIKY